MTIIITLRGDPGMRTGTIELDGTAWPIVTWHRQSGGEVHATTDKAEPVTLAIDAGKGGITIGKQFWFLRDARWAGTVMTGSAMPGVSDAHMARDFPGCGWE